MNYRRILPWLIIPFVFMLAYLLRDIIRLYILEPFLYAWRIERIIYEALPQFFWWALFVLILGIFALRSLRIRGSSSPRKETLEKEMLSMASSWERLINMAEQGNYSRWLFARRVSELLVDIVAHQERISRSQARQELRNGNIEMPAEIIDYVQTGLEAPSFSQYSDLLERLRASNQRSPLDLDTRSVVGYLEKRLDIGGTNL